ncbi:MAG: LysM peptidoglycan-binding domain-containing protein [Bacteroidales bacterium]|nr:LysM peptidoglycan-binding domain-containing protein [Bacteroidales bacterium]
MRKIWTILLVLVPFALFSQQNYTFHAYRGVINDGYNFWVSVPDTYVENQDTMPVIVFLHGHSLCGTDLSRVRKYGCLDAISMGRDINALIIAPQNPGGPWNAHKVLKVVEYVQANYSMDTNRISIVGMSLGGYGTFEVAATYPDKFSAAMALCGGSSRREFCGLNKLPLWIIHGTADNAVPISQSENIVAAMKACGPTNMLRFDRFKGINHSQLAKMFYLPDTYRWLLSHNRQNRSVNKDISITVTDMNAAYQNIDRAANKITVVNHNRSGEVTTVAETTPDTVKTTSATSNTTPAKTTTKPSSKGTPAVHVVKKGDTLYSIAKRYHTTVAKLCKINHIKENSILSLGQKIKLR